MLAAAGVARAWDEAVPDRRRFYAEDLFGNRLEFIAAGTVLGVGAARWTGATYSPGMTSPESLLEVIRRRRSFKPNMLKQEGPSREVIEQLLEAANWAPSHGQTEPWRFTVFTGEARKVLGDLWAEAFRIDAESKGQLTGADLATQVEAQRPKAMSAPVWISLGMQPAVKPDGVMRFPELEEAQAVACAVQNLHLMATALGMGGQWTTNKTYCHPYVAEKVGVTPPGKLVGFFFVGYPLVEWPVGKRGELGAKVRWA